MPGFQARKRRARRTAGALALAAAIVLTLAPLSLAGPAEVIDRPVPSTGCGKPPPVAPGTSGTQTIVSGGIPRSYRLHVPRTYRATQPASLVLSFHGHKRTAQYQEAASGLSATDAIAVYPQGLAGTDGEPAWQGAPYSAAVNDVLFTSDLLNTVQRQLCVDPHRIHATGRSNGGGFTGVLACQLSGRIAAFAAAAGAFYRHAGDCSPRRSVPILEFHGTADRTTPYTGDRRRGLRPVQDWLAGWAHRNHCAADPITSDHGRNVRIVEWRGCDPGGDVIHYRIRGLGHDWPSRKADYDPAVLTSTPIIMRFFARHPLP